MTEQPDAELVEHFVQNRSEAAFAALVQRHVNLVYSTALRHTREAQPAQDITQAVFIILARKAGSLGRNTILPAWLYRTTRLTAANWQRTETRRIRREQIAFMETSTEQEPATDAWGELSPLLDAAMDTLNPKYREALLLRYFQNKTLPEVGAALGVEESAAQKRVSRALEKLRTFFVQRNVTLSLAVIGSAISANSVQAAPPNVVDSVVAAAAKGSVISGTLTTIVESTMRTIAWLKVKLAAGVAGATLLVGGAATVTLSDNAEKGKEGAAELLRASQAKYNSLSSFRSTGKGVNEEDGSPYISFSVALSRPDMYRVDWLDREGRSSSVWSAGNEHFFLTWEGNLRTTNRYFTMQDQNHALARSGSQIGWVFFNKNDQSNPLHTLTTNTSVIKKKDEIVNGVLCAVIEGRHEVKGTENVQGRAQTHTLWIGKEDLLIRKQRYFTHLDVDPLQQKEIAQWESLIEAEKKRPTTTGEAKAEQNKVIEAMKGNLNLVKRAQSPRDSTLIQIYENIVVNEPIKQDELVPEIPNGLKPIDWDTALRNAFPTATTPYE